MLLLLFSCVWFLFMVLTILMARRRGRSEVGYGLVALLISPLLPMLILAIAGDNEAGLRAAGLRAGTLQVCTACREAVKSDATVCRFCRSRLTV